MLEPNTIDNSTNSGGTKHLHLCSRCGFCTGYIKNPQCNVILLNHQASMNLVTATKTDQNTEKRTALMSEQKNRK